MRIPSSASCAAQTAVSAGQGQLVSKEDCIGKSSPAKMQTYSSRACVRATGPLSLLHNLRVIMPGPIVPCWHALSIPNHSPQQPVTVTLDCERFLLRSIASSAADSVEHTKPSVDTTVINRKKLTFLDDLKRLTLSLVSRTAPSSAENHAPQPDKEPLLTLSVSTVQRDGDRLPMAAAITQAQMADLQSHEDPPNEYRCMEGTSSLPAALDPQGPPVQPESTPRTTESVPDVASTPVEPGPHSAAPIHPVCPTVADLKPSAFADATSHPFNTNTVARDHHSSLTVMPVQTPHGAHMTFLSDVELDTSDTVGAPARHTSPRTRLLDSVAAASIDINAQSLQKSSPGAKPVQHTPAAVSVPSKCCHPGTWGNAAPAHPGCGAEIYSDVVTSLIASGLQLFTPPPLFLGGQQPTADAPQPLQQTQLPATSTLPSSGPCHAPPTQPAEPPQPTCTSINSAATAATCGTVVEHMVTPVVPELPRGEQRSPLLTARSARPKFAVPVVAHRNPSKPQGDTHAYTASARHGTAPPVLPGSIASDTPSSCATHATHAAPPSAMPPCFTQEGCDGSSIRAQHNTHAFRIAHDTSVASGPLCQPAPVNDALTQAVMATSDQSVLSCSTGSLHAHTPSYKRPGLKATGSAKVRRTGTRTTASGHRCTQSKAAAPAHHGQLQENEAMNAQVQGGKNGVERAEGTPVAAGEEFNMIASVLSSTPYRMHGMRGLKRTRQRGLPAD